MRKLSVIFFVGHRRQKKRTKKARISSSSSSSSRRQEPFFQGSLSLSRPFCVLFVVVESFWGVFPSTKVSFPKHTKNYLFFTQNKRTKSFFFCFDHQRAVRGLSVVLHRRKAKIVLLFSRLLRSFFDLPLCAVKLDSYNKLDSCSKGDLCTRIFLSSQKARAHTNPHNSRRHAHNTRSRKNNREDVFRVLAFVRSLFEV